MRLITESNSIENVPCVVALGMFDGVHRGHRAIIDTAVNIALRYNINSLVHSFANHPLEMVGGSAPLKLTSPVDMARLIALMGADALFVPPFTTDTARTDARTFIDTLIETTGAVHLVCGENYTFGSGKGGRPELLREWAAQSGVKAHIVPSVRAGGAPVSSTRIRDAVMGARVGEAADMLGRPFTFSGTVSHGRRIGRTLGFPTANIETPVRCCIPKSGVYAAYVYTGTAYYRSVLNIGTNPTVGGASLTIEAHLLNYKGVLYGRRVRVMPVCRLRAEMRFVSVDALRNQIEKDIKQARALLH